MQIRENIAYPTIRPSTSAINERSDVFFRQAQPVDEIVLIAVGMLGSGKSRLYNFADFIEITLLFRSDYQCINHSL